ncbi:MAG: hypothetical protein ROO73_01150 [Roseivirga sp.]
MIALNAKPRHTVDMATVARLLHLALGIPLQRIDRSTLYKQLRNTPDTTRPQVLKGDLQTIRPAFEKVNFKKGLLAIDRDLERLQRF